MIVITVITKKHIGTHCGILLTLCYSPSQDWISAELHSLGSEISLLFICTMSHGFRGHIGGECGSYGEISNLIHRARRSIPSHTPLVSVLHKIGPVESKSISFGISSHTYYLITNW